MKVILVAIGYVAALRKSVCFLLLQKISEGELVSSSYEEEKRFFFAGFQNVKFWQNMKKNTLTIQWNVIVLKLIKQWKTKMIKIKKKKNLPYILNLNNHWFINKYYKINRKYYCKISQNLCQSSTYCFIIWLAEKTTFSRMDKSHISKRHSILQHLEYFLSNFSV